MKVLSLFLLAGLQPAAAFSASRPTALKMNVENVETKDVVKVGVIGIGRIGLVHLEAITKAPGVISVIVSNPTVSKAEAGEYVHRR
jgi:predicted homoserine dehydrogenase-like protein